MDVVATTSDLGLEGISSIDILGFVLCLAMALFAMKFKSFPFMVVAGVGLLVVGFQVASSTQSPIIFLLVLALSAGLLSFGAKMKGW